MRAAGLSTIQQTLTAEAATVLNQSISEASRRNHGQTTPLHVAATLLASPSGFLRQACIKSHPNSSHPLQCRALELCFSVALERLPTTTQNTAAAGTVNEPPISNALMAALKRAQAHQRRGCPEQQQQPLLAVKVELEQLVISILDDPSVSRVMREASFSSPAVKATIEQSLSSSNGTSHNNSVGLGFRPSASTVPVSANRNMYINPRLQQQGSSGLGAPGGQQQQQQHRGDDVKRVIEILLRGKKRNPVLVGESEPQAVIKELLRRIECNELCEGVLRNVEVIRFGTDVVLDRSRILERIIELGGLIEKRIGSVGIVIDLGDLKWLVEHPGVSLGGLNSGGVSQQVVSEVGRVAVAEMAKLLAGFEDPGSGSKRIWFIGTATCETYLRCQVYHTTMEHDWDLQAVPIAAKAPLSGMFTRLGTNGILGTSIESLSPLKGFPAAPTNLSRTISESFDRNRKFNCCPECMQSYEEELANISRRQSDKSEVKSEATQASLPFWLQNAKPQDDDLQIANLTQSKDQDIIMKQRTEELQKKWKETCFRNHPNFHQLNGSSDRIIPTPTSGKSFCNPVLSRHPSQTRPQGYRNLGDLVQLNPKLQNNPPLLEAASPPRSPVRTELALGNTKVSSMTPENTNKEQTRDFLGCLSGEQQDKFKESQKEKLLGILDVDNFKRLLRGLIQKVWWQKEAAAAVASTVNQCKMGNGKRKGKGDIWLFFTGPDRVGKMEMASALAELVNGANPVTISLGSRRSNGGSGMDFRGKTALDKIVEAVKKNPFSVIMLEDIDETDMLLCGNLKRAMERGRLADSYGREISLGNVIFIITTNWFPDNISRSSAGYPLDDEKLASLGSNGLQLRLSLCAKTNKRHANWLQDEHRYKKSKKELSLALSLDLNEAADLEEDRADGSRNSSDLTIDTEVEHFPENRPSPIASAVCAELLKYVDDYIIFKPVELPAIRQDVANSIAKSFSTIMCNNMSIDVPDKVLEKVMAGLWLDRTSLEEWTEKVLVPSFCKLKMTLLGANCAPQDESVITLLEIDNNSESQGSGNWLPSCIEVATNGM